MRDRDIRVFEALELNGYYQKPHYAEDYPLLKTQNSKTMRAFFAVTDDSLSHWHDSSFQGYAAAKHLQHLNKWVPLPKAMTRIFYLKLWPNFPNPNYE